MGQPTSTKLKQEAALERRSKLAARLMEAQAQDSGLFAQWGLVPAELIRRLIVDASDEGGTVQFGRTKRGNALTVRVYVGGDAQTLYADTPEAATDLLKWLLGEGVRP